MALRDTSPKVLKPEILHYCQLIFKEPSGKSIVEPDYNTNPTTINYLEVLYCTDFTQPLNDILRGPFSQPTQPHFLSNFHYHIPKQQANPQSTSSGLPKPISYKDQINLIGSLNHRS